MERESLIARPFGDRDDERLERLSRVYEYVPLALYDEVTKLAQHAVGELIAERDALATSVAQALDHCKRERFLDAERVLKAAHDHAVGE